jgi:hypothetical protein
MQEGTPLTMWAIRAKERPTGFYLALVPGDLEPAEVDAAFEEAGIEREEAMEIGGWKTTSQHMAVAFIPFPPPD